MGWSGFGLPEDSFVFLGLVGRIILLVGGGSALAVDLGGQELQFGFINLSQLALQDLRQTLPFRVLRLIWHRSVKLRLLGQINISIVVLLDQQLA